MATDSDKCEECDEPFASEDYLVCPESEPVLCRFCGGYAEE